MLQGTVKFFNNVKKFGFIKPDTGDDVFVHINDVNENIELKEGQKVTFEIAKDKKTNKNKAVNVSVIDSTNSNSNDIETAA